MIQSLSKYPLISSLSLHFLFWVCLFFTKNFKKQRLFSLPAMTEVLHSPYRSPSSSSLSCAPPHTLSCASSSSHNDTSSSPSSPVEEREREREKQLSLLALLVAICRKSLLACKSSERRDICGMEIGWPTNVRHVAHVTFDRFNGFLGLPVEFEPEVPRRAPSASARVFGVSTESMQLCYDTRGNSVPIILLLMQRRLYAQGGLQAEGIFRINAENSQEEYVRDQLNRGVVPEGIDVHCLAGLIKAWFRELPRGILDPLSPERVMQCETEEDCAELVRLLPPTEAALLDWAINLMADVVQMENLNKMNARNIAMVFAPNMTQMADPLTALMYAVQVMNFLKTLVIRTLREREDSTADQGPASHIEPFDENGRQGPSLACVGDTGQDSEESEHAFAVEEPTLEGSPQSDEDACTLGRESRYCIASKWQFHDEDESSKIKADKTESNHDKGVLVYGGMSKNGQTSASVFKWAPAKIDLPPSAVHVSASVEKTKGISNLRRIDSRIEWIEAWR